MASRRRALLQNAVVGVNYVLCLYKSITVFTTPIWRSTVHRYF